MPDANIVPPNRIDLMPDWPSTPDARYYTEAEIDAAGYYASPYIESLGGGGLIVNGSGLYGNNTNFSSFAFDPLVANSTSGSFRHDGSHTNKYSDFRFNLLPGLAYKLSVDVKVTSNNTKVQYFGFDFFDGDGLSINPKYHMFDNGTLAELTRDFTPGDSNIYLDNVTGVDLSSSLGFQRGLVIWDWVDGSGLVYPSNTYSRRYMQDLFPQNPTETDLGGEFEIETRTTGYTLFGVGTSEVIPAGTKLSRMNAGNGFKYVGISNVSIPTDDKWHTYSGYIGGIDTTGTNKTNSIPPGARTARLVFLPNYSGVSASDVKVWFANIDFRPVPVATLTNDGAVVTTGALGTISYTRGFIPLTTNGSVASALVIP